MGGEHDVSMPKKGDIEFPSNTEQIVIETKPIQYIRQLIIQGGESAPPLSQQQQDELHHEREIEIEHSEGESYVTYGGETEMVHREGESYVTYEGETKIEHHEGESYVTYEEVIVTEVIEEHTNADGTVTRTTKTMTSSPGK